MKNHHTPLLLLGLFAVLFLAALTTLTANPIVQEDLNDKPSARLGGPSPEQEKRALPSLNSSEAVLEKPAAPGREPEIDRGVIKSADAVFREIFGFAYNPAFLTFITISLFFAILAFKLHSVGEWLVWIATICAFAYYYAPVYVASVPGFFSWANLLEKRITSVLPDYWPKTLAASYWPIWNMLICLSLRWGIHRFVRDPAMRRYARSYWFYLAACLAFISIISDVVGINIMLLIVAAISVPLVLMAGFHRILRDILCFFWVSLLVGFRLINIGWRWIVAGATWISKEVRRLWDWLLKSFWTLYEKWLAGPARRLRDHVNGLLAGWLAKVQSWTDKLSIKNPPLR